MSKTPLYFSKYLPVAILYFFLNGFLLPTGLLYTTLLTPFLLIWLCRYRSIRYLAVYFLVVVPFIIAHLAAGIADSYYYIQSVALSFTVYVFCLSFYQYLENCHSLRGIYKDILLINACMVLVSLFVLLIPSLTPVFWNDNNMSIANLRIERLKMLTYEPSYYSTMFAPIAIYYLLKVFRKELPDPALYCLLVLVPLFLSLSFGVIIGIVLTFIALLIINGRKLLIRSANLKYAISIGFVLTAVLAVLFLLFPDNVFFRRIENVIAGNDSSFNGRTLDSFRLSLGIAFQKSPFWGAGFGQVKVLGLDLYRKFYNNSGLTVHDVAIPNSIGDILAMLGLFGVGIKLFCEVYFFFKTRVWSNDYRLALFIFIFAYQFTGSFVTNIAEYVVWIMAFKPDLFPEFNKIKVPALPSRRGIGDVALNPVR